MTTSCLDVLVMGGGLAGCVCARELHDRGYKVLLVEKEDEVGGLLRGMTLSGYDLDLGPHFFFHDKTDTTVRDWVERHCRTLDVAPYAWTFPGGSLADPHPYPISRSDVRETDADGRSPTARPETEAARVPPRSFEDRMVSMAGRAVYERFFRNFTEKFWGVDPRQLRPELASEKIRITEGHEPFFGDLASYRPVGGFREFLRSVVAGVPVLHDTVVRMVLRDGHVRHAVCEGAGEVAARQYVSTLRPDLLFGKNSLHVRGLVLVYVVLGPKAPFFTSDRVWWGYFPNHHSFTRVTDMTQACCLPGDAPRFLSFEFPTDAKEVRSDLDFIGEVRTFLRSCGVSNSSISETTCVRIEEQAPVPSSRNEALLRQFSEQLDPLTNLHRVGRFGRFQFLWMRDVVSQGIASAVQVCSALARENQQ